MVGAAAAATVAVVAAPVVVPLAAGAGAAAAATGGAAAGAVAGGAAAGAAGGAAAAGGVAGAVAPAAAALVALGPIGWIALGAEEGEEGLTWDCWKPILHDGSREPSRGRTLRDVLTDPRVMSCDLVLHEDTRKIIVENQWNENFNIDFVLVHGELAAHASRIV